MGYLILSALILGFFYVLIRHVMEDQKHYKWFYSLKPGDRILVRIYSQFCDCPIEAVVVDSAHNKYITAQIDNDTVNKCKQCAEANGTDQKGSNTCYYEVTMFKREDVIRTKF